jgi:hypothetical protein
MSAFDKMSINDFVLSFIETERRFSYSDTEIDGIGERAMGDRYLPRRMAAFKLIQNCFDKYFRAYNRVFNSCCQNYRMIQLQELEQRDAVIAKQKERIACLESMSRSSPTCVTGHISDLQQDNDTPMTEEHELNSLLRYNPAWVAEHISNLQQDNNTLMTEDPKLLLSDMLSTFYHQNHVCENDLE